MYNKHTTVAKAMFRYRFLSSRCNPAIPLSRYGITVIDFDFLLSSKKQITIWYSFQEASNMCGYLILGYLLIEKDKKIMKN